MIKIQDIQYHQQGTSTETAELCGAKGVDLSGRIDAGQAYVVYVRLLAESFALSMTTTILVLLLSQQILPLHQLSLYQRLLQLVQLQQVQRVPLPNKLQRFQC
ncbi:MAG: hypothetical protein MRQ13_03575 [Candidatus Midichloria sp.]|nr:hypothetical protein [Candidatus Midichloria sp.]